MLNLEKNIIKKFFQKLDIIPEETIMVGNDVIEDGIVEELGVDCYLITDFLVNRQNLEINTKWSGTYHEFYNLISETF